MGLRVRSRTATDGEVKARRRPVFRPRFVVAFVLLLVIVNLLMLEAYANAQFVPDQRYGGGGMQKIVPAAVPNGRTGEAARDAQVGV